MTLVTALWIMRVRTLAANPWARGWVDELTALTQTSPGAIEAATLAEELSGIGLIINDEKKRSRW